MGLCLSCCHSRRRQQEPEREPLLEQDTHRRSHTRVRKAADIFAAWQAGKLPSERQIDTILRKLLNSQLLTPSQDELKVLGADGEKVLEDVRQVIRAVLQFGEVMNYDNCLQDLVYQIQQLNSIPAASEEVSIKVASGSFDIAASAIPSQQELVLDAAALIVSLRRICISIFTSSAFRMLLSEILLTTREIIANTAERVKSAAEKVEDVAEVIEENARPNGAYSKRKQKATDWVEPNRDDEMPSHETKNTKEVVLDRIYEVLRQSGASPTYNASLRTLLYLLRKYVTRVRMAANGISHAATANDSTPINISGSVITLDVQLAYILKKVGALLERLAGGRSLDALLQKLHTVIDDISYAPSEKGASGYQKYFHEIGQWLDTAITEHTFAASKEGREAASRLYDKGQDILFTDPKISGDIRDLLAELSGFVDACKTESTTRSLVEALDNLVHSVQAFSNDAARQGVRAAARWHLELMRMCLGWLLPRVLRAMPSIPMPRIEYISRSGTSQLAIAIDALLLVAEEELIPDMLRIQECSEVRVDVDETLGGVGLTSPNARLLDATTNVDRSMDNCGPNAQVSGETPGFSRVQESSQRPSTVATTSSLIIHLRGLRVAAYDVGYYTRYDFNSWLSYEDEGMLSAQIGRREHRGEGLELEISVEMDTGPQEQIADAHKDAKLFKVLNVRTALPGLKLRISNSKHWLLNSLLLSPLANSIGREIGSRMLAQRIKDGLEEFEHLLRKLLSDAEERAQVQARSLTNGIDRQPDVWDWWEALIATFGSKAGTEDDGDYDTYTESQTEVSLKGVSYKTYTQPEPAPVSENANVEIPPQSENAIAIGLGAQLLSGKGEPQNMRQELSEEVNQNVTDVVQDAAADLKAGYQKAEAKVAEVVDNGIRSAIEARRCLQEAGDRARAQEITERKRSGWASKAFDL